jgi:aspartate beta-hydroxylase
MNTYVHQDRLEQALALEDRGEILQAEMICLELARRGPAHAELSNMQARLALRRGDLPRARQILVEAVHLYPDALDLHVALANVLLAQDEAKPAAQLLQAALARDPSLHHASLLLGFALDRNGDGMSALLSWYGAVRGARREGLWFGEESTPPSLLQAVRHAIEQLRTRRRELLFASFEDVRKEFGSASVARVDRALSGHLREWDATPSNPRQRPRFFFFPDLPHQPYHDPFLQPWAQRLKSAFPLVREEALKVWREDGQFDDYIKVPPQGRIDDYLGGAGKARAWEAFFFYRRGKRFDDHHARCPATSALLESIDLCRIADQAPEICFSVLEPGTTILPHHGVTNVRLVMHLPLVVPDQCALNLLDAGEHHWREGEPVLFDDTFEHEAWNRSDSVRIVLLMDCWNPYLTPVERRAVAQLIEIISELQDADRIVPRPQRS